MVYAFVDCKKRKREEKGTSFLSRNETNEIAEKKKENSNIDSLKANWACLKRKEVNLYLNKNNSDTLNTKFQFTSSYIYAHKYQKIENYKSINKISSEVEVIACLTCS